MERGRTFATGSIVRRRGVLGIIGNVLMVGGGGAAGLSVTFGEGIGEQRKRRDFTEGRGVFPKSVRVCFNPRISN